MTTRAVFIEECFPMLWIAACLTAQTGIRLTVCSAVGGQFNLQLYELRNVVNVFRRKVRKCRHSGLRTAALNDGSNLFVLFIVQNDGGSHQVRALRAASILTM